jgi:hypothetical protein
MEVKEIRNELVKYRTIREKVLRLNEIDKYDCIYYGHGFVDVVKNNVYYFVIDKSHYGCLICGNNSTVLRSLKLQVKKHNEIYFPLCDYCINKKLCTICLCEKTECNEITKRKTTFWLCVTYKFIIPKDIRKLIVSYCNLL